MSGKPRVLINSAKMAWARELCSRGSYPVIPRCGLKTRSKGRPVGGHFAQAAAGAGHRGTRPVRAGRGRQWGEAGTELSLKHF